MFKVGVAPAVTDKQARRPDSPATMTNSWMFEPTGLSLRYERLVALFAFSTPGGLKDQMPCTFNGECLRKWLVDMNLPRHDVHQRSKPITFTYTSLLGWSHRMLERPLLVGDV